MRCAPKTISIFLVAGATCRMSSKKPGISITCPTKAAFFSHALDGRNCRLPATIENRRFWKQPIAVVGYEDRCGRSDRHDEVGLPFGLTLFQVFNHGLLQFAVVITRYVQSYLVESDAPSHLRHELTFKRGRVDGEGGAALPNEWTIRTRFGSAADVLVAKRNGITAALATRTRIARAALSRCHTTVTCQHTAALTLAPSQRSLAASSIHRDRPPKRDGSSSRKA